MGLGMASGMGASVGIVDRVSRAIALGEGALRADVVDSEAARLLALESPWRADALRHSVVAEVTGLGPIQELVDDPDVTDVLVNGPRDIWVDRVGSLEPVEATFDSDDHLMATIERVIAPLGLRIDRSAPMVDARLPDGSRLHAVLPPASVDGPLLAIRRFTQRLTGPDDLIFTGTATAEEVAVLVEAVMNRKTIVVSGGTGAGKTTLLNVLGQAIPEGERVVVIEDASELSLPGHVVKLEARPANSEGVGRVTMNSLLRSALRLRPDRIIVGEVRGEEALDLIWALNTGHRGSLTTVHANSPHEAIWRIETLAMSAGKVSDQAISRQLRAAVDIVVQLERLETGRRVTSITPMSALEEDLG